MQGLGSQNPGTRTHLRGQEPGGRGEEGLLDRIVRKLCPDDQNFEKPLRLVFLSFLALVVCVLTVQNIVSEYRNLQAPQDAIARSAERLLEKQRAFGARMLDSIVQEATGTPAFENALRHQDTARLKHIADALVASRSSIPDLTGLAVFGPNEDLLYPVADAGAAAPASGLYRLTDGIEIAPDNRFAVGVYRQVVSDGELLGYLKLTVDIEHSLSLASAAVDAQIIKICDVSSKATEDAATEPFKVLGSLAPAGTGLDAFSIGTQDLRDLQPFYLQNDRIFMARDLPVGASVADTDFKLLLVKDVTGNVWSFIRGILVSILAGSGLSLIAWAVIQRLLVRLQMSVQTKRSRLEAEVRSYTKRLEANNARLLEAQRIAAVGSWERDLETDEVSGTEEFFRIMRISRDVPSKQILERVFMQIPENERQATRLLVERAINTCGGFDFEHSLIQENGSFRTMHVRGRIVAAADGTPKKVLGTIHDITERTEAERQTNLLAKILESSLNEIYILDAKTFRFEHANKCALDNLGYGIDALKALHLWDINPIYTKDTILRQVRPLQNGELEGLSAECLHKRKDGSEYPVDLRVQLLKERDQELVVLIANDVSERVQRETETREARVRAERLAYFDPLTKLSNRAGCQRDAKSLFDRDGKPAFLVHVDMDNFKRVNDTLGHVAGDYCLEETGRRLREVSRGLGTPYRWGGDEFVIIAENDQSDPNELFERARRLMRAPMEFNGNRFWPTVSMGVALCPQDGTTFDDLLSNADLALYQSKENGKDRFTFFTPSMKTESEAEARIELELQDAVKKNQFFMVFQPQVNLRSQAITGVEALVRWNHPTQGTMAPGQFLHVLEKSNLAPAFGRLVIDNALAAARHWLDRGLDFGRISINVSQSHLASGMLVDHFKAAMAKHRVDPERITAEVLESVFLNDNRSGHLAALRELVDMGIHIELDDFGTGYASLTHVAGLPITGLKIDRSFTTQMIEDSRKEAVVNQLVHLARSLDISVVCEGVETEAQYARLRMMGDFSIQGFLVAEPMTLKQMTTWMTATSGDLYYVI